jgi:DNA-nicking Smr family endonuclease
VRLIHGKGKGVQRNIVRSLLQKHPGVDSFHDAPLEVGSWGATIVALKQES